MQIAHGKRACQVSVSELCRQADISRSAFYRHYSNIADLCHALIDELTSEIERECLASTQKVLTTGGFDDDLPGGIFDVFEAHEELIRVLLGTDSGEASCYLVSEIERIYRDTADAFGKPHETQEYRLMCAFVAWAQVGFLKEWIAETNQPFSKARACFIELQSQVMNPHFRLLTNNAGRG